VTAPGDGPDSAPENEAGNEAGNEAEAPRLTIVNADATAEEVAAIVAVFSSLGGAPEPPKEPVSTWAARHRRVRPPLRPGPGAWRASGLPR
jgi:hypothetical protein